MKSYHKICIKDNRNCQFIVSYSDFHNETNNSEKLTIFFLCAPYILLTFNLVELRRKSENSAFERLNWIGGAAWRHRFGYLCAPAGARARKSKGYYGVETKHRSKSSCSGSIACAAYTAYLHLSSFALCQKLNFGHPPSHAKSASGAFCTLSTLLLC